MPVDYKQEQLKRSLKVVKKCRDCVQGSDAIKRGGTEYLPMLDPSDKSESNIARYEQMLDLAVYTNFTGRTVEAMNGAIWRKDPVIEIPDSLSYMLDNCDGSGLNLNQFAKDTTFDLQQSGRFGILVEYNNETDQAQFKPYIHESIINVRKENGKYVLIVLEQFYVESDDGFEEVTKPEYLVLKLANGIYFQEVYRDGQLYQTNEIKDYRGQYYTEIPFVFIGSKNNDETIDVPPIYALAEINVAHYRNSASVERSGWIMGEPMLIISPSDSLPSDHFSKNPIRFGVSAGINVGSGGDAKILQSAPNTLAQELQKEKVEQMLLIGARLVTSNSGNETATAATIRHGAENSILATIANNTSEAIVKALMIAESMMSENPTSEIKYDIGTEFLAMSPDAQLITVMSGLIDRSVMSKEMVFNYLKRVGLVDSDQPYEVIADNIDSQNPIV